MAKSAAVIRGRIGNYTRQQLESIIKTVAPASSGGGGGSGDITAVTAGTGLSGGATSGAATLNLDVSELSALGATAETSDFVVIQDATDNSTKKVLISNLPAGSIDIDALSALGGTGVHQTEDHFIFSDNGTEKKITFSNLQDAIFADVSGDATIAAGGALTIATDAVESGMLNDNVISGQTELAHADIVDADELLISDGGTLKKVGIDSLQDHYFAAISGDATVADGGALTIAANAVEGSMLNTNAISDQTEMTGDLADTDELMISDAGVLKRADFSVVRDAVFTDISGDATVAAGGAITIAANAVEGSMINSNVAGEGLGYSSNALNVNVDDSTIEINSDTLRLKDNGTTLAKLEDLARGSIIIGNASAATAELTKGAANTVLSSDGTDISYTSVSNDMLAGSITNAKLVNSSVTLNAGAGLAAIGAVSLGGSVSVAVDGILEDLDTLGAPSANGEFIVATGAGAFAYETGNTARTSLGLGTGDSPQFTGVTLTGTGSVQGDLTVSGHLTVNGTTTTVNSTEVTVVDKALVLASGSSNSDIASAGGSGLKFGDESGAGLVASMLYDGSDSFDFTDHVNVATGQAFQVNGTSMLTADGAAKVQSGVAGNGLNHSSGELSLDLTDVIASDGDNRLLTSDGDGTLTAEVDVTYDGTTFIVGSNLSASINMSASAFYGDGSNLSGIAGTITALNNQAEGRLVTIGNTTTELDGEANLTYDGTTFVINDDARINDDLPLYFGTNDDGFIKYRESSDNFLVISGSANGLALSGSQITLAGFALMGAGGQILDEQKLHFGNNQDAFIRYSDPGVLDDFLTISGSASGIVLSGSTVKVDGTLNMVNASASINISASAFYGDGANLTNVPIDLNSLSDGNINVANDLIAFVDADASNVSKKESVSDFIDTIQGDGLQATSGVINIDVSDFAGKGLKDDGSENLDIDVSDASLTTATDISSGDLLLFSDESESNDPTKNITVDNLFKSGSAFVAEDAPNVASDYALFLKGGASGEMIKESIDDFIGAIAGTGIGSSAGQLTHPITAVNTKANDRLVTIGNTTSELDGEANLTFANSQILTLSGTMIVSASSNHFKFRSSDDEHATLSINSAGHTTLQGTGSTGANAGFTVDVPGTIKLDTGAGEVRVEKNSQGMLRIQGNAVEYTALVPTGSNANVDLNFNNSANTKQIATVSSSIDTFVLNQNIAFSSPIPLIHPTIQGGSSGNSTQAFSSGAGSIFYMFSGTGTGDHLTGTLPNPVAIGQKCIVVGHSPNSNSDAVVSYLGQSEISSSAMALKTLRSESDKPAATLFFSTQLYNSDGSPGSVVWAPLEVGAESAGGGGTGDIEGVTAGDGLSGGGATGTVSLALDLNELTAVDVSVANDFIAIIDADDNSSKKESIADLVTGIASTGLNAGSGQLTLDLADVIATDADNRLLTSDGDGTLTAEANITYDGTTLTIDDDAMLKDDHKFHFGTNSDAFIQYREASDNFLVISGSANGMVLSGSTIGNAGFVQLYVGGQVIDDQKLYFGNQLDSYIEYNEDGDDYMVISGSGNGIVLSGSSIQIAGTLEGASPLRIAGEVQFVNQGEATAFKFGPNGEANLHFGTDNYLTIKGSDAKGTVLSGSAVEVQTTNGLGVFVAGDDITHAITLPNSNQANRGKIKANAFVSYSSARYKDNIETLNDPMAVLNQINGVSFNWKDTGDLDYGFIAEDVGKVLPGIVSWEDNKKDAQGMDYLKIISFLVEATKKQQKEIDELKQKLTKQD